MFTLGEAPLNRKNYPLVPEDMTGPVVSSASPQGKREMEDHHLQLPASWPMHQKCSRIKEAMTPTSGSSISLVAPWLRQITPKF
jgi:hypothetical protein